MIQCDLEAHNATPTSALNFKDSLELAIQAGVNVDGHWRQFYAYVFALLAWLSSNLSHFGESEAWIITVAAIGFFTINTLATVRAYLLLNLLIAETRAIATTTNFRSDFVDNYVKKRNFRISLPMRVPLTVLANLVAAGAIVRLVWRSMQH